MFRLNGEKQFTSDREGPFICALHLCSLINDTLGANFSNYTVFWLELHSTHTVALEKKKKG